MIRYYFNDKRRNQRLTVLLHLKIYSYYNYAYSASAAVLQSEYFTYELSP